MIRNNIIEKRLMGSFTEGNRIQNCQETVESLFFQESTQLAVK